MNNFVPDDIVRDNKVMMSDNVCLFVCLSDARTQSLADS